MLKKLRFRFRGTMIVEFVVVGQLIKAEKLGVRLFSILKGTSNDQVRFVRKIVQNGS